MDKPWNRRSFVRNLALLAGALPLTAACAHSAPRVHRIGFMIGAQYPQMVAAFKDELRRLGYVEGENVVIEMRLSAPDRSNLAAQCAELAQMDLELIVVAALVYGIEIRRINPRMPLVFATCPGMVSNGFAQSIEHPGGVATGIDELPPGLTRQRLTLLKTAAPHLRNIALLSTTEGQGGHETQLADAEATAAALGISVRPYRVTAPEAIDGALAAILNDRADGLLNFQGGLSLSHRQRIVEFAAANRLPAMYQATLFAEAGGLMAWAPVLADHFQHAARYTDRILRGASPGDLPITHPSQYYLTINAGAARGLGLTLPPSLLAQAVRVLP